MQLGVLLNLIQQTSDQQNIKSFVCGGVPRDRLLKLENRIQDIDITTGYDTQFLAKEVSIKIHKLEPSLMKQGDDGHYSIYLKSGLKVDFSSNFRDPNLDRLLFKMGIRKPSELEKETYSRDFYCNSLLMSLDLLKIKDITHQGIQDIHNKIIRTCLPPENTLTSNAKRIIRVVYLASKLGFNVDPAIIAWVRQNPSYLSQCSASYLTKNIDKALEYDHDRTIYLINKMDLWNYLPMSSKLSSYYTNQIKRDYLGI